MIQQKLHDWILHPEHLNRESLYELRTLLARYPYFQVARFLYLKNLFLLHDITFGEELRRAALYIMDRKALFSLVEGARYDLTVLEKESKVEEREGVDRTLSLIDAFLSSLPEEPSVPGIMSLPVEAVSDYTSYLEQTIPSAVVEGEQVQLKGQELIDHFLENSQEQPMITPVLDDTDEEVHEWEDEQEDESYFTETLAKIYIKQQRYLKAIEIIQRLNLKYPKKNAYFADQIRFLEKLIINNKSK